MAAKINNFQMFPTPEELIQASNYQQSCLNNKSNIIITKKHSYDGDDDKKNMNSNNCDTLSVDSTNSSIYSFSSSSSDLMEDATSPSSTSSSSSNGPLFQLSDLMDKLPIKRGLSKYYQGKSESFTKLASVESLEDLVKRENPYNKRMKLCRSYCVGGKFCSPKSTISKKSGSNYTRTTSFPSSVTLAARRACSNNFMTTCKPPTIPSVHKHF